MTAMHSALPAAGWYIDPALATRYRWWSGAAWTEHVSEPDPVESRPVESRPVESRPVEVQPAGAESVAPWLTHGVQPTIAPVGNYNWSLEAGGR